MIDEQRPDPNVLLAAIHNDEARQRRGKLKIFLGMAAGVGKTYAMLEAGAERKADGVVVVVGYVETHERADTDVLLAGLEIIPRRSVEYRGATLEEIDLDAVLARKPALALVDELAHTNAPGMRHAKRYQDIVELLEAGIDVYTTVNVQHFESRADAVRQITGITVHEKVPDSLLDLAYEIELIDLPPDELRKRLADGKVYVAELAQTTANNFFRTGNLTALREMALRLTAEHVDHKLRDYMQVKRIAGPWKSGERLMVAVGPSPHAEEVIRWTRRMAYTLEAPWLAVFVETSAGLVHEQKELLARALELVQRLGGEVVMAAGDDVAGTLLHLARQRNVSQLVVGKSRHTRWQDWVRGGALVDRLIRASGKIDIYVVASETETSNAGRPPLAAALPHSGWRAYLLSLLAVAAVTGIFVLAYESFPWFSYQAVGLMELFVVLLIAVYLGRGPAVLAAMVSGIPWNFLFITPRFTFEISQLPDLILFVLYFAIAIVTGNLAARLRIQERQARYNAERTAALYTLAHETATALNMDDVLGTAVAQIGNVFNAEVAILLAQGDKLARQPHPASTANVNEKEFGVATWVYENGKRAGRFTETLPQASAQYLPLRTPSRTVGVIGICMRQAGRPSFDQEVLLETFTSQVALVIERELLDEAAEQTIMLRESERLNTTLLNLISHELRTPIATIAGAASILQDAHTSADPAARAELTADIQSAAERLNRLVENLLDMSRLDAGRLKLKLDWCDIGEVVGVAAQQMAACLADHPLTIRIAPGLPLVQMDFVLMEQVLVNLLDNACSYTPLETRLSIDADMEADRLCLTVADAGPGLPASDLQRIFDKFYRVPGTATGGTGLGLSICRGLVEAHGGTLTATNAPEGGARFTIYMPAAAAPPPVKEAAL